MLVGAMRQALGGGTGFKVSLPPGRERG